LQVKLALANIWRLQLRCRANAIVGIAEQRRAPLKRYGEASVHAQFVPCIGELFKVSHGRLNEGMIFSIERIISSSEPK
jgi:hypothetical protein